MSQPVTKFKVATGTISTALPDQEKTLAKRLHSGRDIRSIIQSQGLLLMLLLCVIFFSTQSEYFLTLSNMFIIITGASALALMAFTQTPLIISGGFDVSVGSVVAMSTVVMGILLAQGMPTAVAITLTILMGAAIGAINAFLTVQLNVNPLIATLGTMSIFLGLAYVLSSGQTVVVQNDFLNAIVRTTVGPVPVLVGVVFFAFIVAYIIQNFTVMGRETYAIGGNRDAARLAGLPVKRLPWMLFVLSSMSAAVAGIVLTAQLGSASPQVGSTFLLSVVTAVILGGSSLAGGRGSVVGTFIAVAILGVLQNGFAQLQLASYFQTMALGVALILAVLVDQTTRKLER
jgi:ribose transport system permease protein